MTKYRAITIMIMAIFGLIQFFSM